MASRQCEPHGSQRHRADSMTGPLTSCFILRGKGVHMRAGTSIGAAPVPSHGVHGAPLRPHPLARDGPYALTRTRPTCPVRSSEHG